jgi:hypothetical protein
MNATTEKMLERLRMTLKNQFRDVPLEFATQVFAKHVELWVYVLNGDEYERVRAECRKIAAEWDLDNMNPEIWVVTNKRTAPLFTSEYEQQLRQRRDEFIRKHGIVVK